MNILFRSVLLIGFSSALELEKDKPFVANTYTVLFEGLSGSIYSNSLSKLDQTKYLKIEESTLDHIEDGALCSSPFEGIKIYGSDLPVLTGAMFGTCPSLKEFKYWNNNNLKSDPKILSENVFEGLRNLKDITILDVPRNALPNMKNLTKLKYLNLEFAGIQSIEEDTFEGTTNVKHLAIGGNDFVELDLRFLKNFKKLKTLNVENNDNLTCFPYDDLVYVLNLEELNIRWCNIRPIGGEIEAKKLAMFCPKLKHFKFMYYGISCKTQLEVIKIFREAKPDLEFYNRRCNPYN